MATLLEIVQDLIEFFADKDDASVQRVPLPLVATTTAADMTSIRATALARGTVNSNAYDARIVQIAEKLTGGPEVGEIAAVDDGGFDGTDKITTSPAFTDEVQDTTDVLMYPRGLWPEGLLRDVNNVLRETDGPHVWIPSLAPDAWFESSDLAKWAAVGSPSERTFTTDADEILLGEQGLNVLADAEDEGAHSLPFAVTENELLLVSVTAQVTVDSLKVELYNETGAEVLDDVTINEQEFTEARFTYTVPAGMEQGRIRFLSTANNSHFHISPPVAVQSFAGRAYACPSWLTSQRLVKEAVYVPQGFSSEALDSYTALTEKWRSAPMPDFLPAGRFATPNRIQFGASGRGLLALICQRPFAELSALTDTTNCDRQYVVRRTIANILERRGDNYYRHYAESAATIADRLGYGGREERFAAHPETLV